MAEVLVQLGVQALGQARAVIEASRCLVFVEAFVVYASFDEGVSLRVGGLGPIRLPVVARRPVSAPS